MSELIQPKISKEIAEKIAYDFIRNKYGNIPHPEEPTLEKGVWIVPIDINYPRIFIDKFENKPIKTRFIKLTNVGNIKVSAMNGEILDSTRFFDITRTLDNALAKIRDNIEKVLVKVGARNFSILPFPEHIHTPILDILSVLLTEERFRLEEFLPPDEWTIAKYKNYVNILEKVGLVRITEGNFIIPGNLFSEMEKMFEGKEDFGFDKKLSSLLAIFFEHGYGFIESVREVLGPHLTISGYIYRESFEFGEILTFTRGNIEESLTDPYKKVKIPRYLIQLERIGLIEEGRQKGENIWFPKKDIFDKFKDEKELLDPISSMFTNTI